MRPTRAPTISATMTAAATRDALIGFFLTVTLFIIREQKVPVVPRADDDEPPADEATEAPAEPADKSED